MKTSEKKSSKTLAGCLCKAEDVTILACSGGSNCGLLSNAAAVKLDEDGLGRFYCLAGLAAHIGGMIESARSAKRLVAIDGCAVACARLTAEHAGLKVTDWVCVTDLGIEKIHRFKHSSPELKKVTGAVEKSLNQPPRKS